MSDDLIITVKADTKEAEKDVDNFGNGAVQDLGKKFAKVSAIAGSIAAAFKAAELTVSLAKAGEEVVAVEKRFELFAKQAGLVPEKIKSGILQATAGTVDMGDALAAASRSIIALESNGTKIPQMFEAAKKAASVFGGETLERFEQISQAIASGNTRSLKEIGLKIDAEKAYIKYADAVGKVSKELSELEKQEALSNAVLDQASERYKNIDSKITPLNEALSKNKIAWNDVYEAMAKIFNESFGGIIAGTVNSMTEFLNKWSAIGEMSSKDAIPETTEQVKALSNELQRLLQMQQLNPNMSAFYQEQIDLISERLSKFNADISATGLVVKNTTDQANKSVLDLTKNTKTTLENMRLAQKEYEAFLKKTKDAAASFGATFKNGVVNTIVQGVASIAGSLAKGENAFANFTRVLANVLGDLAIQMGTVLIAAGIGIESLKVLGGFSAIAAGVGLVAFGAVLKAFAGGGGGEAVSSSGLRESGALGGGIATNDISNTQVEEEERDRPQTGVQVIVQGNILDRRETGLAIAEIINETFDTNGVLIRANA